MEFFGVQVLIRDLKLREGVVLSLFSVLSIRMCDMIFMLDFFNDRALIVEAQLGLMNEEHASEMYSRLYK